MRILARRAWQAQMRFRARHQRHGLVLMYHRVAEPAADPWGLSVTPARFAEHLDVIRRYGEPMPLARLADSMTAPDRPRRSIAITFDDGYADNALNAAPILEAQDMPATIFVVSGAVGRQRDFWWDALARAILARPSLPAKLRLEAEGRVQEWALGEAATLRAESMQRIIGWNAEEEPPFHPRHTLYQQLWALLNRQPADEAERLCQAVMDWAGEDRHGPPEDRIMDAGQVAQLAQGGLIEIGAHTVGHVPLDTLDHRQALRQIGGSRQQLAEMCGRDIQSFSYPFGRLRRETPQIVAEAGFRQACESFSWRQLAFPETSRYRIPRLVVPDLDGDRFAAHLMDHFGE